MRYKTLLLWLCCLLICLSCSNRQVAWSSQPPKNVILFIGDGMGFEHVKAAGMYASGAEGGLCFESFPYHAQVTTSSAGGTVTDSAAAATAMATGIKVNNSVLSVANPGDGRELPTVLELYKAQGKSTGLVTTTFITHATPAAFGAHEPSRNNYSQITQDYMTQTRPNILLGGIMNGGDGLTQAKASAAGYTVLTDRAGLQGLDTNLYHDQTDTFLSGQFPGPDGHMPYEYSQSAGYASLPHLSEMTAVALDLLDNNPTGFFLMVEGGRIDMAAHENRIEDDVCETVEFAKAVQQAVDWAAGRSDTLILVTADHETGGLAVQKNKGKGMFPDVSWSSAGHTGANVPLYAWGTGAQTVQGLMDNTDIFDLAVVPVPTTLGLAGVGGLVLLQTRRW